jgi:HPt (histidine-containing phosphotransfer) domain-containing protein
MHPRPPHHPRSQSILVFVGTILALHTMLATLWIAVSLPMWAQILGLFVSFALLLFLAKVWWVKRLVMLQDAPVIPVSSPVVAWNADELQAFVVEHLHFAVVTVHPDLRFRRETPIWPKTFRGISESEDFVEWLGSLIRLSSEEQRAIQFQLTHSFGMNAIQWKVCLLSLPKEGQLKSRQQAFIRLNYVPRFVENRLVGIHIVIQDVSEAKEQEVQARQQRKEVEKFFAILQVSDSLFELFMSETRKLFDDIKQDLKLLRDNKAGSYQNVAARMFRAVHTIKANAKLFKLNSIQDVAHQVESYLQDLRSGERAFTPQTVTDLTQNFIAISEEVYSYASLRKEILNTTERNGGFQLKYRVQWIRSLMNQFASILRDPKFEERHLKLIQKEFSRALSSFDKSSLREYIRTYDQMLQDVAQQLGKEVEPLQTNLEYHHFESTTLARVNDILLHCIRNAVYHGIEKPEERLAAGKPRKGRLTLTTCEKDGIVQVELSDDGRGIDVAKVKAKAVDLRLITAEDAAHLSDTDTVPLLFHSGVSTAPGVTEISGRGLGMDVIRDYVQVLSGQLNVTFVKGQRTSISVRFPAVTEEFITPLAIHDLRDIVGEVLRDYVRAGDGRFQVLTKVDERVTIFSDRLSIVELLRMVFAELHQCAPADQVLLVQIEEHLGRRRVDSHSFYRLKVGLPHDTHEEFVANEHEQKTFEGASHLVRKSGGSLYVRGPFLVELNLPSNIPVRFAYYEFKVLIFTERFTDVSKQIDNFFKKVMGGWIYKSYQYPFSHGLPPELDGSPCLVLLDSALLKTYVDLREEADRKKDGVVLLPEEELDIDTLNGSAILPENILFVPPSFDEKHFHRSLAGVIFRRFLKEMVREPQSDLSHRDLDLAGLAAS